MTKPILIAALAATLLGGAALAQQQAAPAQPTRPMRADTDHDGFVTRDEYMAKAAERFAKVDVNRDNRIDRAERRAARGKMRGWRHRHHHGPTPTPTPTPGA